jgi:hypothetical protein
MFVLGYTELFHPSIHGFNEMSYQNIHGHFISVLTITIPSTYLAMLSKVHKMNKQEYYYYINDNTSKSLNYHSDILFHIKMRNKIIKTIPDHPNIRNFLNIQETLYSPSSLQIIKKHIFPSGERICILKTFWIRCIQRKWKKICEYNNNVVKEMKKIKNLKKRELSAISSKRIGINGLWYLKF